MSDTETNEDLQVSELLDQLAGLNVSSAERTTDDDKANEKPDGSLTLESIVEQIQQGKIKNIITMAGAGISTSAGIPDFRSKDTGLYSTINEKYPELPSPESIFDIDFFKRNPRPFYDFLKELCPKEGEYQPTPCHKFIKKLNDKNVLLRHYTQNIDGLEFKAGLPEEKLIEAHGSFRTAHCIKCKKEHSVDDIIEKVRNETKMVIPKCGCGALVKPDIVFFGENLPKRFFNCMKTDFMKCDLLIIMGTSLTVHPFASLVNFVDRTCQRILINFDNDSGAFSIEPPENKRNLFLQGTCDDQCKKFLQLLKWNDEIDYHQ